MRLNEIILTHFKEKAAFSIIEEIHLGLGYSVVTLTDGRCGLCHTWIDSKDSCTLFKEQADFEGGSALELLQMIHSENHITRSAVIALVNALNQGQAASFPDDTGTLFEDLGLRPGSRLAMVGYFAPVVRRLQQAGIEVKAHDIGKGVGDPDEFYGWARKRADAMILTVTSVINNSIEGVFSSMGYQEIPTAVMGPSTIMAPELYDHLPVTVLAGTLPLDTPGVLKAIRNGKGTPELLKFSKKVYWKR